MSPTDTSAPAVHRASPLRPVLIGLAVIAALILPFVSNAYVTYMAGLILINVIAVVFA